MSLSDLASLASIVSGVAVAVTLLFLLLQMRQADKNQRAAIRMARATRANDLFAMMSSPDIARVLAKAWRCDEDLSEVETAIFLGYFGALLTNWEDTYFQYQAGTLDKAVWESELGGMRTVLSMPAHRAMWQILRTNHGEEFRRHIEKLLVEVPASRSDLVGGFKMLLDEQMAQAKPFSLQDLRNGLAGGLGQAGNSAASGAERA